MTRAACAARICAVTTNILKRLLIHAGGFNLGLVMRQLFGVGTPRGLQGRLAAVLGRFASFARSSPPMRRDSCAVGVLIGRCSSALRGAHVRTARQIIFVGEDATFTTGC